MSSLAKQKELLHTAVTATLVNHPIACGIANLAVAIGVNLCENALAEENASSKVKVQELKKEKKKIKGPKKEKELQ